MTKLNSVLKKNSQLKMAVCSLIITDDSEILKNENVQLSSKEKSQFCNRIIGTAKLIKGARREAPEIIMKNLKAERTAAEKITHDILSSYELGDMSADEVLEMSLKLVVKALLIECAITRDIILKAFPEKVSGEVIVEEKNSSSFRSKKTETNKHKDKAELVVIEVQPKNETKEETSLCVVEDINDDEQLIRSYMNKLINTKAGNDDDISLQNMIKNITVFMTEGFKETLLSEIRNRSFDSGLFKELLDNFSRFAVDKYLIWFTDDGIVDAVCAGIIFRSMLESPQEKSAYLYQYRCAL